MAQRNTVNVIEYLNSAIRTVHAFTDDGAGNKEAEALFRKFAKDNDFPNEDIENGIEEGFLDHSDGNYQLFIVHSE